MTVIATNPATLERTPIQEFYAEQNIFITGGTGFLGKVLIEKLLRSCPDLSAIYLLIRPKKGKDVHERLDNIFDDPPMVSMLAGEENYIDLAGFKIKHDLQHTAFFRQLFARLKTEQPKYRHKIVVISGDCSLPNLGLSNEDRDFIIRETSIVFNVAATVRFDEKMKYAVAMNVTGSKEVMCMCRSMHNIKAIIHVSTAYSNCNYSTIEEKFYPAPMSGNDLEKLTEWMDESKLSEITPVLLGDYPNTYCLTKAIAESTVKESGKDLPLGIFRPAMVISTANEPIEGWTDNVFGPTGGVVGAGAGLIRVLNVNSDCLAELIPVDLTVNALIATAWDVAKNKNLEPEPPIYNYVATWDKKSITWGEYNDLALKYGVQYPVVRSLWCYVNYSTKYTTLYNILTILLHIIPALILDTGLLITGQSPKVLKLYKKIHKFAAVTGYFAQRTWDFHNDNTRALWDRLAAEDQKTFFFSMANFDWDSYMHKYIRGVRLYIFKEDPSTIPAAQRRMATMKVFHEIIKSTLLILFIWSSYQLGSLIMSISDRVGTTSVNENILVV